MDSPLEDISHFTHQINKLYSENILAIDFNNIQTYFNDLSKVINFPHTDTIHSKVLSSIQNKFFSEIIKEFLNYSYLTGLIFIPPENICFIGPFSYGSSCFTNTNSINSVDLLVTIPNNFFSYGGDFYEYVYFSKRLYYVLFLYHCLKEHYSKDNATIQLKMFHQNNPKQLYIFFQPNSSNISFNIFFGVNYSLFKPKIVDRILFKYNKDVDDSKLISEDMKNYQIIAFDMNLLHFNSIIKYFISQYPFLAKILFLLNRFFGNLASNNTIHIFNSLLLIDLPFLLINSFLTMKDNTVSFGITSILNYLFSSLLQFSNIDIQCDIPEEIQKKEEFSLLWKEINNSEIPKSSEIFDEINSNAIVHKNFENVFVITFNQRFINLILFLNYSEVIFIFSSLPNSYCLINHFSVPIFHDYIITLYSDKNSIADIYPKLSYGLMDRITAMHFYSYLKEIVFTEKNFYIHKIGLTINYQEYNRILDKGPLFSQEENEHISTFKSAFTKLVSLRKFNNNELRYCVLWENKKNHIFTNIFNEVISFLLSSYSFENFSIIGNQYDIFLEKSANIEPIFNRLIQEIKDSTLDLPIHIISSFLVPNLFSIGENYKYKSSLNNIFVHDKVINVILQLENSNKYINNLKLNKNIKYDYLFQIFKSFSKKDIISHCNYSACYCDVIFEDFVFRLFIYIQYEYDLILSRLVNENKSLYHHIKDSQFLQNVMINNSLLLNNFLSYDFTSAITFSFLISHRQFINNITINYPSFKNTYLLISKYLSIFSLYFSNEVIELLLAYFFTRNKNSENVFSSSKCILFFLYNIINQDWKKPLIINYKDSYVLNNNDINDIFTHFHTNINNQEVFIYTKYDKISFFTLFSPNNYVLKLLVSYCTESFLFISKIINSASIKLEYNLFFSLFKTENILAKCDFFVLLKDNDTILEDKINKLVPLNQKFIIDSSFPSTKKDLNDFGSNSPLVIFNSHTRFINELILLYRHFFYLFYSNNVIYLILRNKYKKPLKKLKSIIAYTNTKINTSGDLMLNFPAIINDITMLGDGLVLDIFTDYSQMIEFKDSVYMTKK